MTKAEKLVDPKQMVVPQSGDEGESSEEWGVRRRLLRGGVASPEALFGLREE